MKLLLTVSAISLLMAIGFMSCKPLEREPLNQRQLETPRFEPLPPDPGTSAVFGQIARDLTGDPGHAFLSRLIPSQATALWLATVILIVVGLDLTRPLHPRNLELLALLPIGFLLFDVMRFFELFDDPVYWRLMDWVFIGIMAVSLFLFARALARSRAPHADEWRPRLDRNTLMVLTIVLLLLNVAIALVRLPDDVGFYSNLGAQRLRERWMFPYGDPLLTNTPGATYSPILYYMHLVYQVLLAPIPLNGPEPLPAFGQYVLPPIAASQLATITFHLIGVVGLFIAARRMLGAHAAWGATALYCGSAYVMGVGGERETIGGMTFASHIAPAAVTLAAFAALPRPALAGGLLATAMATLFYPAFMFPAWLGFYWRSAAKARSFVAGFVVASLLIGVPVLLRSQRIEGRGMISTILHETQGHQQDPNAYGSSPFGFWGLRDDVRALLREPLVAGQPNTSPAFLLFAAFVLGSFFLARGASEVQLALLTGALAIGSQLWKIHGTGVYVTWYYGFLLLGFLGHQARGRQRDSVAATDSTTSPSESANVR
ncbi:MAG TPA: hypothetical protein VEC39_13020 [Vicinamibacterales bacterium]|nr:hypothetical protein [Vicinamibacterales bacterium]